MSKFLRKIMTSATALLFLLNMSSAGAAATTVSAEVGFIFNTFWCWNYDISRQCKTKS